MYIIIIGAGAVGADLARSFHREGHDVVVIDRELESCRRLAQDFDGLIINDDGTSLSALQEAGIGRADCLAAVTGSDKDNMIVCGLAKKHFSVSRTIGRVNDPVHEQVFKTMGVDFPVSAARLIARAIETESALVKEMTLFVMKGGEVCFSRYHIDRFSPVVGKTLKELELPRDAVVAILERGGEVVIPRGETAICAGDQLYIVVKSSAEVAVRLIVLGPAVKRTPAGKAGLAAMEVK
ncbi:MAG TPA: NAD-binding protein [Candidatus Ozemobacteraceae bacterium]|nr:NAD-binding protein [Candidatus Ozemobacteraceae bacterium]